METACYFAATLIGAAIIGYAGLFFIGSGIVIGLVLYHKLAIKFQKDAALAYDSAYQKAYAEHVNRLNDRLQKRDAHQDGPFPKDKHDDMKTFEESVAAMYPDDKNLQEVLIQQKREREGR